MAYIRAHFCAGHVGQVLRVSELAVIALVHVRYILSPVVDGSLYSSSGSLQYVILSGCHSSARLLFVDTLPIIILLVSGTATISLIPIIVAQNAGAGNNSPRQYEK